MSKFVASIKNNSIQIDDALLDGLDLIRLSSGHYHVLYEGKSHEINSVKVDLNLKVVHLNVDDKPFSIFLKDEMDVRIEQLGLMTLKVDTLGTIKAPMPGLVLHLLAQTGEQVQKGDPLIILEAMKMENILKSDRDGVVTDCIAQIGDKVDKGQVLMQISPEK